MIIRLLLPLLLIVAASPAAACQCRVNPPILCRLVSSSKKPIRQSPRPRKGIAQAVSHASDATGMFSFGYAQEALSVIRLSRVTIM